MIILRLFRIIDKILMRLMRWIGIIGVFIMTISIIFQIISRFAGTSATWTEELSRFIMIWLCFLATAYIFNDPTVGKHVRVDILISAFPPKLREITEIFGNVVIFIVAILAVAWGGRLAMNSPHLSPAIRVPYSFVYSSLPTGMALIAYFSLHKFLEKILGGKDSADVLIESEEQ